MTTFDLEKCLKEDGGKCRTRDGREARYLGPLAQDRYAFAIMDIGGGELLVSYKESGRLLIADPHPADLVNLPRKLKCWVVMWRGNCGGNLILNESFATDWRAEDKAKWAREVGCKPVIVPVEADEPA
ncbi:MAG: hypothetical protein KIT32_12155 [Rhodocyclaceae bacterium]|nr:hypothetical protein [Rhodocyclaceae bacterium]